MTESLVLIKLGVKYMHWKGLILWIPKSSFCNTSAARRTDKSEIQWILSGMTTFCSLASKFGRLPTATQNSYHLFDYSFFWNYTCWYVGYSGTIPCSTEPIWRYGQRSWLNICPSWRRLAYSPEISNHAWTYFPLAKPISESLLFSNKGPGEVRGSRFTQYKVPLRSG